MQKLTLPSAEQAAKVFETLAYYASKGLISFKGLRFDREVIESLRTKSDYKSRPKAHQKIIDQANRLFEESQNPSDQIKWFCYDKKVPTKDRFVRALTVFNWAIENYQEATEAINACEVMRSDEASESEKNEALVIVENTGFSVDEIEFLVVTPEKTCWSNGQKLDHLIPHPRAGMIKLSKSVDGSVYWTVRCDVYINAKTKRAREIFEASLSLDKAVKHHRKFWDENHQSEQLGNVV